VAQLDLSVDPKQALQRKLVDAHEAAALVESRDLIWIPASRLAAERGETALLSIGQ
jgi:hypothetical protein